MPSLSEKAKAVKLKRIGSHYSKEEVEAGVAIIKGEVSISQVTVAQGKLTSSRSGVAYRLLNALTTAYAQGLLKVEMK